MVIKNKSLYKDVVNITRDYLGPASERFIDRQIQSHLNKDPGQLTGRDIAVLIAWSKIAMALLTNNDEIVDEFANRLNALSRKIA